MPARAAAGGSFMHPFELGCDLLEGGVWRRGLDAGDQADEAVITALRRGAGQQDVINDSLGSETLNGAAQPFDGPGAMMVLA